MSCIQGTTSRRTPIALPPQVHTTATRVMFAAATWFERFANTQCLPTHDSPLVCAADSWLHSTYTMELQRPSAQHMHQAAGAKSAANPEYFTALRLVRLLCKLPGHT